MKMKRKLGINIDCIGGGFEELRTLEIAHETGFEAFTGSKRSIEEMSAIKEKAVEYGMDFPFLHSPYSGINNLWLEGDGYRAIFDGITESVDVAAACEVGAVVTHVSSGWQAPHVNDLGLSRFDALVEYAAKKGVTLAFENLRMVGNLACLVDRYEHVDNVRFCYDCGHEPCYTKTVRWMDIFKRKMVTTHIHDNFGTTDAHTLPFYGSIDWESVMKALADIGYRGNLNYEASTFLKGLPVELRPDGLAFMAKVGLYLVGRFEYYRSLVR
jgi:sugar phosphate isomerase/epimerase